MPKGRILVVDDDPDTLSELAGRLHGDGYSVCSASDGTSCMAQVRREDPDLVVLDLHSPAGDAYLTLEHLRDNPHWSKLPVVVLTADGGSDTRTRATRAGATAFFDETTDSQAFLEMISRLVAGPESSSV
jgi:CheY-like chemotaxis protein